MAWCERYGRDDETLPSQPRAAQGSLIHYVTKQLLDSSISTAESALAGIVARVPVGSAPELSHRRTEPRLSCRACGTYRHGLNVTGNNLPIRRVPTPRR